MAPAAPGTRAKLKGSLLGMGPWHHRDHVPKRAEPPQTAGPAETSIIVKL